MQTYDFCPIADDDRTLDSGDLFHPFTGGAVTSFTALAASPHFLFPDSRSPPVSPIHFSAPPILDPAPASNTGNRPCHLFLRGTTVNRVSCDNVTLRRG